MAQNIPPMMRSLVARKYCAPSGYEVIERAVPTITNPDHVLVRVHAASISFGETQIPSGQMRLLAPTTFPYPISISGSGIVVAVGSRVTALRPGDAVYGLYFKHGSFLPPTPGFASDYTVVPADVLLVKPSHLSFEEAAALSGSALVLYQCMKRYFALTGQGADSTTLEGKTVFVSGALSAFGSVAVQVAKNVYGARRVVSTVSTAKMGLVEEYLPGIVDEVVDYQTQDVVGVIGRGTVDLVLNMQFGVVDRFPLARPDTGAVVSIASVPSAHTLRAMMSESRVRFRWLFILVATLAQLWYRWNLRGTNIKYDFVSGNPGNREDLEGAGEWVAAAKIKALMTVVSLDDIEAVRRECGKVAAGKAGLGKLVIKIV